MLLTQEPLAQVFRWGSIEATVGLILVFGLINHISYNNVMMLMTESTAVRIPGGNTWVLCFLIRSSFPTGNVGGKSRVLSRYMSTRWFQLTARTVQMILKIRNKTDVL